MYTETRTSFEPAPVVVSYGAGVDSTATHPDLFERALAIEDAAVAGRHGVREVGGLGGYASSKALRNWRRWAESEGLMP